MVTKEGTQETAVTLIGLIFGILCAQRIAHNQQQGMILFLILTGIHIWSNYQAVYVLHVESINPTRAHLLVEELIQHLVVDKDKNFYSFFDKKDKSFSVDKVYLYCLLQHLVLCSDQHLDVLSRSILKRVLRILIKHFFGMIRFTWVVP